jgi:hypothetical protein
MYKSTAVVIHVRVREDVNSADFASEFSGYFSVLIESCHLAFGVLLRHSWYIRLFFSYLGQGELE